MLKAKTMKTQRFYTVILLLLTILFAMALQASTLVGNKAKEAGNYPAENLFAEAMSVDFYLEEEEYINDIPFDTKWISANCLSRKAMSV